MKKILLSIAIIITCAFSAHEANAAGVADKIKNMINTGLDKAANPHNKACFYGCSAVACKTWRSVAFLCESSCPDEQVKKCVAAAHEKWGDDLEAAFRQARKENSRTSSIVCNSLAKGMPVIEKSGANFEHDGVNVF